MGEQLRPVSLPDLSAPVPIGKELDAARERVSQAHYESGEELDLGSGGFVAPSPDVGERGDRGRLARRRQGRHRRFGEGIVVTSRLEKGDEWVTVAFVGQGVKELIAAYAGLERT